MIQTHAVVGSVMAIIASMFESGDSLALLWGELSKWDVKLKNRDKEVTLLNVGHEKLSKA